MTVCYRRLGKWCQWRREMARRRTIVGGIFASLDRLGWAKSRLRGLWKVDCEGFMASIAHNVLKTVRRLGSGTGSPEPSGSGGYAQLPPSLHGRKLKIHPRPSPFHHQKQTFSTSRRKWASIRPIWHCQLVREPRQDATLGIDEGLWDVRWSWCRRSTESGWQHRKRDGSGR